MKGIEKMRVFMHFEEVENEFNDLIEDAVQDILLTEAKNGEREQEDVIYDYISHKQWKERLKTIIGLSGGSVEKLKRVYAVLFPNNTFSDISKDKQIRKEIARFLSSPEMFEDQVPSFIRKCFYLRQGWVATLRDKQQIQAIVCNGLQSKYAVRVGLAQEKSIGAVVSKLGLAFEKGPVEIVDNKEVDVAIPSLREPSILIMSSYALTTSSSQSSRANEQSQMYESVQTHNRRRGKNVLLWNVIDGGGWLERIKDLEKMIRNCDEWFSNMDLEDGTFEASLRKAASDDANL